MQEMKRQQLLIVATCVAVVMSGCISLRESRIAAALVGEWRCVDSGPGEDPVQDGASLFLHADGTAQCISTNGTKKVFTGTFTVAGAARDSGLVFLKWKLTPEQAESGIPDEWPFCFNNGTNLDLQAGKCPRYTKVK